MNAKRFAYHLEVCPGTSCQGPTDAEIEGAIRGLPGGVPSFVILRKKKNHFMQAAGCPKEGFSLEFQEFSIDGHWEHKDSPEGEVDVEVVVSALVAYAKDEQQWRDLPWVRLPKEESEARSRKAKEAWEAKQPKPGFFRTFIEGIVGQALVGLGIADDKERR